MSGFDTVTNKPQINRDRWGRPLVIPPGGGKPVAYTRATTFVDVLDDKSNLAKWQQRQILRGILSRPDLMLQVSAALEDDRKLQSIADEAMQAAGSHSKADIGTALHALTELVDSGGDISSVPAEYKADLDAYARLMDTAEVVSTESFTVLDEYQVAGTHDRRLRFKQLGDVPVIGDVKTGRIDYGLGKIAMQLAVYAHSEQYNHHTGARTHLDVRTDIAVVIHLPAGQGTAEFVWVDITKAWRSIDLAAQVRLWRKDKHQPIPSPLNEEIDLLPSLIDAAACEADLIQLWVDHQPRWTEVHTQLAAAKKAAIYAAAHAEASREEAKA